MTFQYLTLSMFENAKSNGGMVDHSKFKTAKKYGFDSLYFDELSLNIVDDYVRFVRQNLSICNYSSQYKDIKRLHTAALLVPTPGAKRRLEGEDANLERRLVPYYRKCNRIESRIEFIYLYIYIYMYGTRSFLRRRVDVGYLGTG